MTTTVNIEDELKAIDEALLPLCDLELALEEELKETLGHRCTGYNRDRPFQLREALSQLREGVPLGVGMDSRVYAVLSSPEMRRFKFKTPGIQPLLRRRASLLAQQALAIPTPPAPRFEFRYTGPPWGKVAGQRRQTGDVLRLSEQEAAPWAQLLERV